MLVADRGKAPAIYFVPFYSLGIKVREMLANFSFALKEMLFTRKVPCRKGLAMFIRNAQCGRATLAHTQISAFPFLHKVKAI